MDLALVILSFSYLDMKLNVLFSNLLFDLNMYMDGTSTTLGLRRKNE